MKADVKTSGSAINYIFQTRPGADRGYYLMQDDDNVPPGSTSGVGTIIGNNCGDVGIGAGYNADGTWIYIAAAIDLTPAGMAFADLYAANLTAGETSPTLILNDRMWGTGDAIEGLTGVFGIGGFAIDRDGDDIAEASQEWFEGAIDYVAIYEGLLGADDLHNNLKTRLTPPTRVPEPGSAALVLFGGVLLAVHRRVSR